MKNIDNYLISLEKCILPSENEIKILCDKVKEIFIKEDNVVILNPPVSICGDLHGQFHDLLQLFEVGGRPPLTSYCFAGDYVDRGSHGIETFLYLILLKIRYPEKITMLRGNHECRSTTQNYGFYKECAKKFGGINVYNYIADVFDLLPISAVIGERLFVVHGGLSPSLDNISDLDGLDRKMEIQTSGIISDLVWSDPDEQVAEWEESSRGAGFTFNQYAVKKFNEINNIDCVFRSHQMAHAGYHYMFNNTICIVWSAPNYCYSAGNDAAILEIDDNMGRYFNVFGPSENSQKLDEFDEYQYEILNKPAYFL